MFAHRTTDAKNIHSVWSKLLFNFWGIAFSVKGFIKYTLFLSKIFIHSITTYCFLPSVTANPGAGAQWPTWIHFFCSLGHYATSVKWYNEITCLEVRLHYNFQIYMPTACIHWKCLLFLSDMILYSRQRRMEGVRYGLGTSLPPRGAGKARGEYGRGRAWACGCSALGLHWAVFSLHSSSQPGP